MSTMSAPDLLTALGGPEAIEDMTAALYRRIGADPILNHVFAGSEVFSVQRHMRDFLVAALGGTTYGGRTLDHVHRRVGVTEAMFEATVGHIAAVLAGRRTPRAELDRLVAALEEHRPAVVGAGRPRSYDQDRAAVTAAAAGRSTESFQHFRHLTSVVAWWRALAAWHGGEVAVDARYIASRVPGRRTLDQAVVLDPAATAEVMSHYADGRPVLWTADDTTALTVADGTRRPGRRVTLMLAEVDTVRAFTPVVEVVDAEPDQVADLIDSPVGDIPAGIEGLTGYATTGRDSGALAFRVGTDVLIVGLGTRPEARRQGLGTAVLHRVLADTRDHGVQTVTIQATSALVPLASTLGFQPIKDWQEWLPV